MVSIMPVHKVEDSMLYSEVGRILFKIFKSDYFTGSFKVEESKTEMRKTHLCIFHLLF